MIVQCRRSLASLPLLALGFLALTPSLAPGEGRAAPPSAGSGQALSRLVAHWKFDEGQGTQALDSSGQGNHGTIHGAVWTPGRVGGGLQFDGVDDYVEVAPSPSLDGLGKEITLLAWIKTPLTARHSIMARWLYGGEINQRCLELDVSPERRVVSFGLSSDGAGGAWCVSSQAVPQDQWVHLAATSDGVTLRIYLNGEQDPSTFAAPSQIHPSTATLHLGAWFSEGELGGYFQGIMDDLRIYSRALSPEEILKVYADTSPKGTVAGKVIDLNGKPIREAQVKVGLFPTTTDKTGKFQRSVPEGTYEVQVSRKGYQREVKPEVEVWEGKTTVANVLLTEDETPPSVSEVRAENVASLTAVVRWETDERSDSTVAYGKSPGQYTQTARDGSSVKSHRVALTGLDPDTRYYFRVESRDGAENLARGPEFALATQKPGGVVIWDTHQKYTMKNPFPFALADQAKWTQVPYGQTDYEFVGDPLLENDYFYLFLFTNKEDSVALVAKLEGGGLASNEIYKVYEKSLRYFGMGTLYTKILRYTPDVIEVEHAGENTRAGTMAVTTNYAIQARKPYLEIVPVANVNQQGMHGKTRLCAYLQNDGGEYLLDSKREPWTEEKNIPAPEGAFGIINFVRGYASQYDFMWFLTFPPGAEQNPLTYLGFHADPFWGEEVSPDRPSVGAQYASMEKKVAIGVLRYRNCWTRENVEKPIQAGEVYQTTFAPPYPGKWRLIARVDQTYQATEVEVTKQDVAAHQKFSFTSHADGQLDYLLMYLRERNGDTPEEVYTPQDVYQEAILGQQ